MAGPGRARPRPVHAGARQHRRERGAALHRARSGPHPHRARVGRQRLRHHLRQPAAAQRPGRRRGGPAPHVPHGPGALRRRVRRVRRRLRRRRPGGRPVRAGPGRGGGRARRPVDGHPPLRRPRRAHARVRHLGWPGRAGRDDRRGPVGRPRRPRQLALDVLRQRAGRRLLRTGPAAAGRGEPLAGAPPPRLARRRPGDDRARRPDLRRPRGRVVRLGRRTHPRAAGGRRRRRRRLRARAGAGHGPSRALHVPAPPHPGHRLCRRPRRHGGVLLDVLQPHPVHAGHPGLHPPAGGPGLPPLRHRPGGRHRLLRRGRPPVRPGTGPRARPAHRRGRPRPARADPDRGGLSAAVATTAGFRLSYQVGAALLVLGTATFVVGRCRRQAHASPTTPTTTDPSTPALRRDR